MSDPVRVVFDCNIFLQGLAAPAGPAGRCVQLAFDGAVHLFICAEVLNELRDVASRPSVVEKLRLTFDRVDEFVESIELAGMLLQDFAQHFIYDRDPR